MATKTTPPLPNFPTFNVDALVALQKANVETLVQVQKILTAAAEAAFQAQIKRFETWQGQLEVALKGFDVSKKPEAYAKEAQAAVETVMAEAKAAVESGVKTQREVAQILADRAVANLNELKALAA
jgi:hypothetical protein